MCIYHIFLQLNWSIVNLQCCIGFQCIAKLFRLLPCLYCCKWCCYKHRGQHVSFWIVVFPGYMPRGGIAEAYGNSLFSFLKNVQSGCTILHFHQQWKESSFFSTPSPAFIILQFLMVVILTGVRGDASL